MICPIEVPNIRDRIFEHVGPQHVRRLRLVSHAWNKSAVGALAAASNCQIRVTPVNIDEYASSRLLRGAVVGCKSKLKIALGFGRAPTRDEFQHLIDVVSNKLSVDGSDGPDCVVEVTFHGADDSFAVGPPEWNDLLQLLILAASGLRSLDLFDKDCLVADCTFLHQRHYYSKLAFPALEELAYCWQEPTMFLLDALLLSGAAPQLTKVRVTVRDAASSPLFPFMLRAGVESLQHLPRLTELTLALDLLTCGFLARSSVELHTVHRLCLHIHKNPDGGAGLLGEFIGRMFPEVRSLDLRYEPQQVGPETDSWLWFPWRLGPLPRLESLGYGWIDGCDDGGAATTGLLKVRGSDLMRRDNFPALRSLSTDLGLELSNAELGELQVLTAHRVELHISTLAFSSLPNEELRRRVANLRELCPHVTCLAFNLGSCIANSRVQVATSFETIIREFRGIKELEIQGGDCHGETGRLLQERNPTLKIKFV